MSELNDILFSNKVIKSSMPIVVSSRIRLARNLEDYKFPQYASNIELSQVADLCKSVLVGCKSLKNPKIFAIDKLNANERCALVEAHLCSIELAKTNVGGCLLISDNNASVVMINEEDHLRLQVFSSDLDFKQLWLSISEIDDYISSSINIAYDDNYGFLTACPTNVGTGMRGSVMVHLPGLVLSGQINTVIGAVQKLGFVARGIYGEGSSSLGSLFQFSNQHTLGLSEVDILSRLYQIIMSVIDNEEIARKWLLKNRYSWLHDAIGRSFGLLCWSYSMSSEEAISHLSNMRLAVDFGYINEDYRTGIDRLMTDIQPSHIQVSVGPTIEDSKRDINRSEILRNFFVKIPELKF